MYHKTVASIKGELDLAVNHSFTTDAWTNKSMTSFITTTVHYIHPTDFKLTSFVLDTVHVTERHTSDNLVKFLEEMEQKWGLKDVVGVSDNASNIQTAFSRHGIPHLGCFAHTINLAVSKGLDDKDNSTIKRLLGRARALVSTFRHSYIKTEDLKRNEKLLDLQKLQLVTDVCTRWNSVFYMINRLLAVYPAVYAALYASQDKHLLLGDDDRKNLEDLSALLEPFEKVTTMVSAEKQPTAGLVLPYLENLVEVKLKESKEDTSLIKKFKKTVRNDLKTRYNDPEQRRLLSLVTVLDPRVRTCDWMDSHTKDILYEQLKESCMEVASASQETGEIDVSYSPAKRQRSTDDLDGLIKVCSQDVNASRSQEELTEIVEKEIIAYKMEHSFGLGYKEPLQWWKLNCNKYPTITKVMMKYLHIPASSVASERVFSTAGRVHRGREHLTAENANIMIFLYHNYAKGKVAKLE